MFSVNKLVDKPRRQVHLIFHVSPFIPDVGFEFNAMEFAQTGKRPAADSAA
jgi:hypothetical protein